MPSVCCIPMNARIVGCAVCTSPRVRAVRRGQGRQSTITQRTYASGVSGLQEGSAAADAADRLTLQHGGEHHEQRNGRHHGAPGCFGRAPPPPQLHAAGKHCIWVRQAAAARADTRPTITDGRPLGVLMLHSAGITLVPFRHPLNTCRVSRTSSRHTHQAAGWFRCA